MADVRASVSKFGKALSGMVMPNIGAFIAWGFLTALFIETGWLPNAQLAEMVSPILKFLLPILIAGQGGYMVAGQRGRVIGSIAVMGAIKLGDDDAASAADAVAKRKKEKDDGRGGADSGQRICPEKAPHNDGIRQVVNLLENVPYKCRQCKTDNVPDRITACHICRGWFHFFKTGILSRLLGRFFSSQSCIA